MTFSHFHDIYEKCKKGCHSLQLCETHIIWLGTRKCTRTFRVLLCPPFLSYWPTCGAVSAAYLSDEALCVDSSAPPSPHHLLTYTLVLLLLVLLRNSGFYKLRVHLCTRRFMSPIMSQYLKGCWGLWIRAQSCGCTKYVAEILCALYFVFWMLPPFLPKSVKFSPCESVFWTWIAFPPRLFFSS